MRQLFEKLKSPLVADFHVEQSDGTKGHLTIRVKNKPHGRNRMSVTFETQERIIRERADFDDTEQMILITNKLSKDLQEYCQENHINFIDTAGNMVLCKGNFYVCITGQKVEKIAPPKIEFLTIGMVKTVFAMFAEASLLQSTVRDIANKADVSVGMVQKTLDYLAHNDFLQGKREQRKLTNTDKLKVIWNQGFLIHIAAKRKKNTLHNINNPNALTLDTNSELSGAYIAAKQMCLTSFPEQAVWYCDAPFELLPDNIRTATNQRDPLAGYSSAAKHTVYAVEKFWGHSLTLSFDARKMLILADLSDTTCNNDQALTQRYRTQFMKDQSSAFR